jgi:hypothetical protein
VETRIGAKCVINLNILDYRRGWVSTIVWIAAIR